MNRILFYLTTIAILVAPQFAAAAESGKTYKLSILFNNDNHGRFWKNRHNEGGFSAVATLVKRLRSEAIANGYVPLVLNAGDINTGVPESDLQDAQPDFVALNYIGVDAMALGNHEFDNDLATLDKQIGWAKFPMLAANIVYKSNQKPVYQEYATYSLNGLRIAILGLVTADTPLLTNPDNYKDIEFLSAVETAEQYVPQLKESHDFVLALTHLGYYEDGKHGANSPGDYALALANPQLDLIIGGHSHVALAEPVTVRNTIIAQAGEYNKYLGRIDLSIKDGLTTVDFYRLYPINLTKKVTVGDETKRVLIDPEIPEDQELLAIMEQYQSAGSELINVEVGSTEGNFIGEREIVRASETNLGNLIAYVGAQAVKADVAIMNSGGIRASLPPGVITYRDILTVQPFGNTITSVVLSGQELAEYVKTAASKTVGSGGFPQFYGLSLKMVGSELVDLKVHGQPVDENQSYKLAVNNFLAAGGDGYLAINDKDSFVDSGFIDADVLRNFFEQEGVVIAADFAPEGKFIRE